jgi:hypothetical protein
VLSKILIVQFLGNEHTAELDDKITEDTEQYPPWGVL